MKKTAAISGTVPRKIVVRSDIDGRTRLAKLIGAVIADQGGADRCSEVRVQLIRRFCATAFLAEQMDVELASGKEVNVTEYCMLSSTLTRLAGRIGIARAAKTVPSLAEYLSTLKTESVHEIDG